jgi:HSP20 family protein
MTAHQSASDVIFAISGLVVSSGLGVAPLLAMNWIADQRRTGVGNDAVAGHIRAAFARGWAKHGLPFGEGAAIEEERLKGRLMRPAGPPVRPTPRAPFFTLDLFPGVRREMGRLIGKALAPIEARSFAAEADESVWPSLDVHVTDQAFLVDAEVPGLEPGEIELGHRDGVLTIEEKFRRAHGERCLGRFRMTLHFATEIDADDVEANFESGVLTIRLPKNPKPKRDERRITISVK